LGSALALLRLLSMYELLSKPDMFMRPSRSRMGSIVAARRLSNHSVSLFERLEADLMEMSLGHDVTCGVYPWGALAGNARATKAANFSSGCSTLAVDVSVSQH
jgi:hypothetical protein